MTKRTFALLTAAVSLSTAFALTGHARESWASGSEDTKRHLAEAKKFEDAYAAKVAPELDKLIAEGKYRPWAAKPSDLEQAGIPAFPGAEGGGMYSYGGRGGKVFVVTSLEDSGPGTLREACEAVEPRIVVFNVAGVIHLDRRIQVLAPYITIGGQTAPGDGVCVAGDTFEINTHDVVIRYMRFRRGETDVGNRNDGLGGNPVGNVMVDHCSCSWGFDENVSMYRHMYQPPTGGKELKLPTVNITIQWTISSEAPDMYNHAFGGTWGGTNDVFHHDLFACNTGRNCSMGLGGDFNYINNVVFNWRHRTVDGGDETSRVNSINNYFKPGPITPAGAPISYRIIKADAKRGKNIAKEYGKFYVSGNIVDGNPEVTADNWAGGVQIADAAGGSEDAAPNPDAPAPSAKPKAVALSPEQVKDMRVDEPFPHAAVTIQSAQEAYESVLASGGASLPKRDAVDQRVIEMVRSGKVTFDKGIIKSPKDVGGYPEYHGEPLVDTDHDGIPDAWEVKYGLNPNDPSDASKDMNGDGYTNIEKYLNGLDPTKKVDWKELKNNVNTLPAAQLTASAK